jgi:hypothetical protein
MVKKEDVVRLSHHSWKARQSMRLKQSYSKGRAKPFDAFLEK